MFHPHRLSFIFMQTIPTCMHRTLHYQPRTEQGRLHFLHWCTRTARVLHPSWAAGTQFCLRFAMPNYARLKKQVTHCSVPGTQSYRAGLYKQALHCCLYLRILIMCVFGNRRCLVIEKYCPFTFFFLSKTWLDMNCTLCIFYVLVPSSYFTLEMRAVGLKPGDVFRSHTVFLTNRSVFFRSADWTRPSGSTTATGLQQLHSLDLINFL